jgi:hypothetical protein
MNEMHSDPQNVGLLDCWIVGLLDSSAEIPYSIASIHPSTNPPIHQSTHPLPGA